jgi:hypothetical protein
MNEILGYASGVLVALSAVPYIRDILRRKTTPQRTTWLIWSILLAIAFFAQLAKGGTWSLLLTFADFSTVLIIYILSFKYGVGGRTKFDIWALVGAGIGLVMWYFTNEALTALLITIFIDFIGGLLTLVKAYKEPYSETFIAYMICASGAFLGVLSVGEWNFSLLVFPAWICLFNFSIGMATVFGKRNLRLKN